MAAPDDQFYRDTPIELPDGTLRCQRHFLEVCGKCCVDYTFMREIIGEAEEEDEEEDEEEEQPPDEGGPVPTRRSRCAVCRQKAPHRCSRCRVVHYCGEEHQKKDWKAHKATCKKVTPESEEPIKPSVLAVTIWQAYEIMDELQDEFFASIESRVDIFEARNPTAAIKGLRFPRVPIAVIIMDGLKPRTEAHKALLTALLGYAKNEPGIVIFAFGFPSFQIPPDIAEVFETFGVYWSRSNYSREMFHLNNARVAPSDREVLKSGKGDSSATATAGKELGALQELIRDSGQILAPSYSMKALQLSGVSAEDAVYVYERDLIKKPKGRVKENRLVDAAVALTRVGKGRVAYIGDVNSESMTELLVRAMIGLEPGSPRTDRRLTVQLS